MANDSDARREGGSAADPELLRKGAKRAYKAKEFREAERLYQQLLTQETGASGEVLIADHQGYAAALIGLGRLADATGQLEQAVALAPGDARLQFKLGEVLSRLGRHTEAIEHFLVSAEQEPGAANTHWRLALELRAVGREEESRREVARCLEIEPGHVDAQILQMQEVFQSGSEHDGQAEEAQEMAPPSSPAYIGTWSPAASPSSERPSRRYPRWMVAFEAVGLVLIALWIRSQWA